MSTHSRFLLMALSMLLGTTMRAQDTTELSLLRAVARDIRGTSQPDSNVYLNRRILPAGREHSASAISVLVDVLGARVARLEDVIECVRGSVAPCRFVKGSLLISIGEPAVNGDTALLRIRFDRASSDRRMPVNSEDLLFRIVRQRGGDWKVIGRLRERIT